MRVSRFVAIRRRSLFVVSLFIFTTALTIYLISELHWRKSSTSGIEARRISHEYIHGGAHLPSGHLPKGLTMKILEDESYLNDVELQHSRLERLHKFCTSHVELWNSSVEEHVRANGFYYSKLDDYNIVECRIPKTGTTLRSILLWSAYHGGRNINDWDYQHPAADKEVSKLDSVPTNVAARILQSYFAYIFVRDPLMKIISSYFDKIAYLPESMRWLELIGYKMKFVGVVPSLGKIIKFLADSDHISQEHFAGYFTICNPCLSNYNLIGRQETLSKDFEFLVANQTELWRSFDVSKKPWKYEKKRTTVTIDTRRVFDDVKEVDLRKLAAKFWAEYEAFGYDPEDVISFVNYRKTRDKN